MRSKRIKIGILVETLSGGGAERSAGLLSSILCNLGYDVFVIILFDDIAYPFSGKLINLGEYKAGSRSFINKFWRYRKLQEEISHNKFDLILDFRMKFVPLRELLLNRFAFKTKMVNMVRSYKLDWYLPNPKILSSYLYKNYAGINTVSFKMKKQIEKQYSFKNVSTIHNPLNLDYIDKRAEEGSKIVDDFIIAIGRFDANKQFDKLINSYSKSVLPERNIKLYIMGDCLEDIWFKQLLIDLVNELNLKERVKIMPFQENPFTYIKQAKFLVLSSKNEGFPRVLIESLACNTPVVSFNCNSGPNEIITHEQNGLLVRNQDFKELTNAMNRMIMDGNLYNICKANSLKGLQQFSMETIGKQWNEYINDILGI